MLIQTKQRLKEILGSASGNDMITEFAKLDAIGGGSVGTSVAAHTVLAGPTSGSAAASTFRVLAAADIPTALTPTTVAATGAISAASLAATVAITGATLALTGGAGFYGTAVEATQPTSGHVTTSGFTAVNTSTVVAAASTFTGGSGSSAYSISDIVLALKQLGLIAT